MNDCLRWIIASLCNAAVTVWMLVILLSEKHKKGAGFFRYFTTLSNVFAMAGSALILPFCLISVVSGQASVPGIVQGFKYVSAVSVCVTFLTVMLFLGPTQGYPLMFAGDGLYLHLIGPLLSVGSCCFAEKGVPALPAALIGLLPTVIYGTVYYLQVIVKKRWEDFYGFNRGGKWYISVVGMLLGTAAICILMSVISG